MITEISLEMILGRQDPYKVAENTKAQREVTPLQVQNLDVSIRRFLETGVFISEDFEFPMALFGGGNTRKYAERLAQYNYHLATLVSTDKDLIADIAFTLFQIKENSAVHFVEREELSRKFYSSLIARNLPPEMEFLIHFMVVDLYVHPTEKDKKYFNEVITYGAEAMRFADAPFAKGSVQLCNLLYWLGLAYNEIGEESDVLLKKSITLFEQCLDIKEYCKGPFLGSVLNSLGYSYILLGKLTDDKEILKKAVSSLQEALPYRQDERLKLLTENNLRIAQQLLSGTYKQGKEEKYDYLLRAIELAGRKFTDAAVKTDGNLQERTRLILSGMDELCSISRDVYDENDPYLLARFELIMGLGLLFNGDNLPAVCFLNASRRKWDMLAANIDLPRKAAAYYNLGLAFSTMEGLYSETAYVKPAIEKLSHAKKLFNELKSPERAHVCDVMIEELSRKLEGA
jgi:hypothetical protein